MKTFFVMLCCLPFFLFAQATDLSTNAPDSDQAALLRPTGCVSVVVDQICGGSGGHTISGTIAQGDCSTQTILKVKVRYRNLTDNKSWNTREYDYNGNWYVQRLDPDKEYEIQVSVKFSRSGLFRAAGTVRAWSSCNRTRMTVNGASSGQIDVCGNNAIIMDGSASTDETGYIIAIREINAAGSAFGPELLRHFSGRVPARIDIRAFAASQGFALAIGKRYYVKLVTKPIWREEAVWINLKSLRDCARTPVDARKQVGAIRIN